MMCPVGIRMQSARQHMLRPQTNTLYDVARFGVMLLLDTDMHMM